MVLEDYRVRKAVAIVRWVMGVWHVELESIKAMLSGLRLGEWLRVRHMPEAYWRLLCMLEAIEGVVSVLWRYAPFPDDNLVFFWLSRFIKEDSYRAKL
ncbi:MAG: hypothetical protein ABDH29_03025 [Aquificaceae bacterium]